VIGNLTPTRIRPRSICILIFFQPLCLRCRPRQISPKFLLYQLSYDPNLMEPAGFEPATRVVPTAFVPAFPSSVNLAVSLSNLDRVITDTQCSAASFPAANSAMVSNTWSEKPPTFRMSARSAVCVVLYG